MLVILGALIWTVLGHVAGLDNETVGADILPTLLKKSISFSPVTLSGQ